MATDTSTEPQLKRHIGIVGLLFASVGSIIGSGWLFGALNASKEAGPAAVISWALGAVMVLAIALVYGELGVMFPLSGGVIRYPHLAFGSLTSYTFGWITWVGASTTAPIEVLAALQYATQFAPFTVEQETGGQTVHTLTTLGYIAAVVLMALFVVINYFGIRWFARLNTALVWWKLAIIVVVIVAFLIAAFHGSNFTAHGFIPQGWHGVFSAIATSGIVFSYLGFRQGVELGGETDNPRRNVPIAVVGSVLVTAVLYIALQVAFIAALDPSLLTGSDAWANLDFENSFGPLAALATALGLGWLAVLLYIDAIVSPGDTGLIYTTLTSRLSYAMARNGNAPQRLAKTTDRGVPLFSLIVTFVVGLIVFLPFPSWQQLVGFITSATVLSFASGPLALAALRKRIPDHPRPFRVPGGHAIPVLAFWASNLIVYWSGWLTGWKLYLAVLLGFVLLALFKVFGGVRQGAFHFREGFFVLFPWLAGLALISFLGNFPEKSVEAGNLGVLNFELSAVLLAGLSVLVYVIANKVCLSTDAVLENIEQVRAEAAVEEEELGAAP